jgi:uncharacterized protein YcbX
MFKVTNGPSVSDFIVLAPALGLTDDAAPIEDVLFLRDNIAALAWAVERTLNGSLDLPVDGYERYLARLRLDLLGQPAQPSAAGPDISYTLEYPVPDNWIPMTPVLTQTGSLVLRRGTMDIPGPGGDPTRAAQLDPEAWHALLPDRACRNPDQRRGEETLPPHPLVRRNHLRLSGPDDYSRHQPRLVGPEVRLPAQPGRQRSAAGLGRIVMKTDASPSPSTQVRCGSVVGLWRYPVKSMMGEELNATEVTKYGLIGDRKFAIVDPVTGKVAGAKNPRKWGNFFEFRATYVDPPHAGAKVSAVRLTLPDGTTVTSDQPDLAQVLSKALGRQAALAEAPGDGAASAATAEEYWPDMEGLEYRDTVTDWELPPGTFFDLAIVHLLTTATIDRLRALYPQGRFEARRFRPNIVVETGPDEQGFVENDWLGRAMAIGDEVRLQVTGTCPRCVMTTLPQGDLPKDSGILRTAAQHNHVNVGIYADVIAGGTIRRGDPVTLA